MSVATFTVTCLVSISLNSFPISKAEPPQLPTTIEVTPIRRKFSALGFSMISSACVCTSMKPGDTIWPVASISVSALPVMVPILAMRPWIIAISAK